MHFKIIVSLSFILSLASCKTATSQLNNPRNIIYNWKTDTAKKTVPLSEFTVVLPKGAFSVLTFPKFVKALEGLSTLDEAEISQSKNVGSATLFNAMLDGQRLTFQKKGAPFKDLQTQSSWDVTGRCFDGPLNGKQLRIEPHSNHFAFAWLAFYPNSEISLK